jgi:hypothetical protein
MSCPLTSMPWPTRGPGRDRVADRYRPRAGRGLRAAAGLPGPRQRRGTPVPVHENRKVYDALTVAPWMLSSAAGGQHATYAVTNPTDLNPRLPPGRRSRSCGNNGGGRQMSGSQQKADPKLQ